MSWSLEEAIAYYRTQGAPGDQSALIGLLREVQRENGGGIPLHTLTAIAEAYAVKESFLLAVIKRIPSLHLADTNCLELCAGPNCSKCGRLAAFVEKTYGESPKTVTLKYVPCMRMCGKGPNIRWNGKLYHQADEQLLRRLIEGK
ncbi:MAG: NAD(P)H-dependent oxidoreductase subunit E [Eubacteriales bacterium]|nr:NAD(P)H-dependent oxidoreductase subunit E [Eubacteriales bacterium]